MPGTSAPARGVAGLGTLWALPAGAPRGSTCRTATCLLGGAAAPGALQPGWALWGVRDGGPRRLSASRT